MRLLLALLLLVATVAAADEPIWRDNPAADDVVRPGEVRPVLLYFTAPWCGPCKLLVREFFEHPDGQAELDHYDLVRLDLEDPAGRSLADSLRVGTVPTFVLLAPTGDEVERIRGYRSRRTLLRDLSRFRAGRGTRADLTAQLLIAPDDPVLQAELGLRQYERFHLEEAAELLGAGLRDPAVLPDTLAADAARALADLHRRRGESAEGAMVLEDLLASKPGHAYPRVTWQLLATCRREIGDSEGSVAALRKAAAIEPIRAPALADFAQAAARQGMWLDEAETAARLAVDMTEGTDPTSLATLATVMRYRRQYPEAMMWIKRAMAAAPDDARWPEQRETILRAAVRGE